jgi:hypothetical protein
MNKNVADLAGHKCKTALWVGALHNPLEACAAGFESGTLGVGVAVLVRQRSLRVSTKFRVTGLRASVFFDVILNDFLNLSRRRAAVTLRKPLDLTLERLGQGDEKMDSIFGHRTLTLGKRER